MKKRRKIELVRGVLDGPEEGVDYSLAIPSDIGLGDEIVFSSIPENYYRYYGKKLIDENKRWFFDHNPYVVREGKPKHPIKRVVDVTNVEFQSSIKDIISAGLIEEAPEWHKDVKYPLDSKAERFAGKFGISEITCRSPRLYKYEDPSLVKKDQVVIHTEGASTQETIDKHVIEKIKERYNSYKLIQIGRIDLAGCQNEDIGVIDKRNLDIWDTVEVIATSAIFIGVNSGPLHIASCYPRINKKVIINTDNKFDKEDVKAFLPLNANKHTQEDRGEDYPCRDFEWLDYGIQYYNDTKFDIGCTHSYKKI